MDLIDLYKHIKNNYDYVESGHLFLKTTLKNGHKNKLVVGYKANNGYLVISIKNKPMLYHRIIWLWHHKTLPKYLDHINRNKKDNRIDNLRPALRFQNMANIRKLKKSKSSIYKGVSFNKKAKKYVSSITFNGVKIYLGAFGNEELAAKAYDEKAKLLWGEFACTNF